MNEINEVGLIGSRKAPTLAERETIITFNETNAPAEVFTYNPRLIRKLDAICKAREEAKLLSEVSVGGAMQKKYSVPKKWVKVSAPRQMSEEQRVEAAERLRRMREKKQK